MSPPPFQLPRMFRRLSAKFLICLVPAFLVVASTGFVILSQYENQNDKDALAARIGNLSARVAESLAGHHAYHNTTMADDLISYLAVDRAVLCAEFVDTKTNRVFSTLPARIGCRNIDRGNRLVLPVGPDNTAQLIVRFSDTEVLSASSHRRAQQMILVATAFVISLLIALAGFRFIVARPLTQLHASIQRISQTGERIPVTAPEGDELGDIIIAFNEMIERETDREGNLAQANNAIRELNHSLEERVRHRTEQLLDNERNLRDMIENFSSGIYIHAGFKPLYANQTLIDMYGFGSLEDFMSIPSTEELLAPDERARIWGYHQARLEGRNAPKDYDFHALRQNGEKFLANNRSFVVDWEGQRAVCTTLYDLTARQATERNLAEQQHLMASLLATTQEGFWFIDLEKRTTDVNPAMCQILGRPRDEIIGKSIMEFVDDANADVFRNEIARRLEGHTGAYEISLQRPDGSLVPCLNNATPLLTAGGEQIGSVGIWADISEIKMTQRSLEHEKERAQAASVAKSEFLAIASHELRTPMNGVLGMTELLLQTDISHSQREQLQIIAQSGEALLEVLEDILDISKIESGRIEIESVGFDLRAIVGGVAALMGSRARQKGLAFDEFIAADIPETLIGDGGRVRQILINIVGNAVKFTENGNVRVDVSQTGRCAAFSEIRFEITDTGPGINEDAKDLVFEKFAQADSSTTRNYGGTGLGLAISQELVKLMGGEIGLETTMGKGSTFWFTIKFDVGDVKDLPPCAPATVKSAEMPTRQLAILLAEDNPINQEIARQTLVAAGHSVQIVNNGSRVLGALQREQFDLILMDVHMPEMDGIAATRQVREFAGPQADIPIIALTADAMSGSRQRYLDAGMTDYLSKPFKPDVLFATISRNIDGASGQPVLSDEVRPDKNTPGASDNQEPGGLNAGVVSPIRENKPQLWSRLVELYLQNTPEYFATLTNALNSGDIPNVELTAHTMKSSCANLGALKLSALLAKLEAEARETAHVDTMNRMLVEVQVESDLVIQEMRKTVSKD